MGRIKDLSEKYNYDLSGLFPYGMYVDSHKYDGFI